MNTAMEIDREKALNSSRLYKLHSALSFWLLECAWPGLGLFGESYLLFSIGTLTPLWELLFPECFRTNQDGASNTSSSTCNPSVTRSMSYMVVLGVICGMMLLGTLANTLGRRRGSILTAVFMCGGAWGMTVVSFVCDMQDANLLFQSMVALLFVFGVGVGGEYPLSASSASERAMAELQEQQQQQQEEKQRRQHEQEEFAVVKMVEFDYSQVQDEEEDAADQQSLSSVNEKPFTSQNQQQQHNHRGRRVQLVFTMQGMGIMCNCIVMTFLLVVMNQDGTNGQVSNDDASVYGYYDASSLVRIWRITYAIGAAVLTYVLVSRILYLQESQVWQQDHDRKTRQQQQQQQREEEHRLAQADDALQTKHPDDSATSPQCHDQQQRHGQPYQAPDLVATTTDQANAAADQSGMQSDVSSLSAPSVQVREEQSLRDVPSTTREEDLKSSEIALLLRNYGCRLFGASMSWFLWDIAFYGNKLFQASFLLALTGENTTLLEMSGAATLNAFVALCGYFCAAALIDKVGRVALQQYGFLLTGILFCCCGFFYESLATPWLVTLYFMSSFFGQCGPNATTFVIPSEIFPTEMRTMCHGIAAASGKAGALLAAVSFSKVQTTTNLFLWSGYASFTAAIITFLFVPETTDLNLYETDRRWRMILEGKKADYLGAATMPKYLSFYERQKMSLQSHGAAPLPDDSMAHDI